MSQWLDPLNALAPMLTSELGLYGVFVASFLAATLLPGGSEAVLLGVLALHPQSLWPALLLATLGNTLGGMVTFAMGWILARRNIARSPVRSTADIPPIGVTTRLQHLEKVRAYGLPVLLLAWVPVVGDGLCLAAGWLQFNPWAAALLMALGKFARYWVITIAM